MAKVKWLVDIWGQTYGEPNGVRRGGVSDLPEEEARRMIKSGYAQADWRAEPGPPYQEQPSTVRAGLRQIWDGWKV